MDEMLLLRKLCQSFGAICFSNRGWVTNMRGCCRLNSYVDEVVDDSS
jgi:hypothetical protein